MLAMPEINHIKKLRNIKSLSINEISKRTGFSWVTVKKYADEDQLPSEKVNERKVQSELSEPPFVLNESP